MNFIFLIIIQKITSNFDNKCNTNLALYWGQNSYGAVNLNEKQKWEKDLKYYCDLEKGGDIFIISFLNEFNSEFDNKPPGLNLANHCETNFNTEEVKNLKNCPRIGEDIKYCQVVKKKKILLSLGGAIGRVGFNNKFEAERFADTIWNMFLGGTHKYRPFGHDVILDGIDLDIEHGSPLHYGDFLNKLKNQYFKFDSKYLIAAAPQCFFPDRALQLTMESAWVDMIFIQFYNNWCGLHNYENKNAWNYLEWSAWAKTKAFNKNVKLYLGAPASKTAAGFGYVDIEKLKIIIKDLMSSRNFGGVMMWDASQAENNLVSDSQTYGNAVKDYLLKKGYCSESQPVIDPVINNFLKTNNEIANSSISHIEKPIVLKSEEKVPQKLPEVEENEIDTNLINHNDCPIQDHKCDIPNQYLCNGNNFGICNNGKWVMIFCPINTTCVQESNGVYCDHQFIHGEKNPCA